jgi:hypothetical protein
VGSSVKDTGRSRKVEEDEHLHGFEKFLRS